VSPLLLVAAGAAAFLLYRKGGPPTAPLAKLPPDSNTTPVQQGGASVSPAAIAGAGSSAIAAAGGVSGAASSALVAGAIVARGVITGGAAVAGYEAGKVLDVALGGREGGVTSTIASVGMATVASVASLAVAGSIFFAFVAVVLLVPLSVAYAVGSIITDASRLAYGQDGAARDYWKRWYQVQGELEQKLLSETFVTVKEGAAVPFRLTPNEARRISWSFADGYMLRANLLAFQRWMRAPRGWGISSADEHGLWGSERGYFVGRVVGGELVGTPAPLSEWSLDYFAAVPWGDCVELIRVQEWEQ
jgi:hypothetical protein